MLLVLKINKVKMPKKSPQITNANKNVKKRELSYMVGENINWHSQYGKEYGGSTKTTRNRTTT